MTRTGEYVSISFLFHDYYTCSCFVGFHEGRPHDHNGVLEAAGLDEQDGNGANLGTTGINKEGRTPKLPPDTVNKLLSLQDFVSLEMLEVKDSIRAFNHSG